MCQLCAGEKDKDYEDHIAALLKFHIPQSQWIMKPLQNPDNNFVDPLFNRYLIDLEQRNTLLVNDVSSVAATIRRTVRMQDMHDIIQTNYMETVGIAKKAREKEEAVRAAKAKAALEGRCSQHIRNKFLISKKTAFKRQNSFAPPLEPFIDIDD
jgi:ABC-type proline/glycine betaine transport system ATPase subunit